MSFCDGLNMASKVWRAGKGRRKKEAACSTLSTEGIKSEHCRRKVTGGTVQGRAGRGTFRSISGATRRGGISISRKGEAHGK